MNQNQQIYDVVIIGAGLSGLTAADELSDLNLLVLEKEEQAGGRVLTCSQCGVYYDLGAVFACNPDVLPFKLDPSHLICESDRIGIFYEGTVHYGSSVIECLCQLGLDAQELEHIKNFYDSPTRDVRLLPESAYKILSAFFQVIHPGEMKDYLPQRQEDAFLKFATHHYKAGNGEVIEQFVKRLGSNLKHSAEVIAVEELEDCVQTTFKHDRQIVSVFSKAVILTSPAPVALRVLRSIGDRCRAFLNSLHYEEGTVVSIGFQQTELTEFSYLVTPDLPSNTILKQNQQDGNIQVLLVYYVGEESAKLKNYTKSDTVRQTLEIVRQLNIGTILDENVLFSDVQPWSMVGPVISQESYSQWDEQAAQPSPRVFISGDYVYVEPESPLPYGMIPAILSGKNAAHKVRNHLSNEAIFDKFRSQFLTDVYLYQLTSDRPIAFGKREEGNIAFYGLILQAFYDENLKNYLLQHSCDSLWEYQIGFGVTAEDSALVIEGLLEAGVNREILLQSANRLVELFYCPVNGAFETLSSSRKEVETCAQGRASYWMGVSVDATAHVGYLLARIAPDVYQDQIEACSKYLQKTQNQKGYWKGQWFPSILVTTYYALRLLCQIPSQPLDAIQRAKHYILESQEPNGSWHNSVIETAAAILALKAIGLEIPARAQAKEWLLSQKGERGWLGEPVLYYWFEFGQGQKLFHHCTDKGQVTTAWATLALKS